jgi:flagellar biosynthesis protein
MRIASIAWFEEHGMSIKKVVGVSFDPESDGAPVVMLKGAGAEADAVLERAKLEGDVPVVGNAQLANALYRVPIDAPIGRELFPVMAAVLAHVIQIDKRQNQNPRSETR